jgi:tripartite-type tricarboxylate transporter receptor subunit TctC
MVGMYAANPGDIIAVSASLGVKTLDELVAKTKEKPGTMTVATNIGATTQVSSFMLAEAGAAVKQVDVGGITDKIAAILGGHVDIIIGPYGNIKPYLDSGEMVALGVTAQERAKAFSDIPTCIEQGYNVYFPTRFFLALPKGTDKAIVDKMSAAVEKLVTTNEEYAKKIYDAFDETPLFLGPEEALAEYAKIDELINKYSLTTLG